MYLVWKKRPLSSSRPCVFCGDRGVSRTAYIPHLVESRRVDGRSRQAHIARLPSIRNCCLRSDPLRAAWWRAAEPLLERYGAADPVWFKLYDKIPPVPDEDESDDWLPPGSAQSTDRSAAALGLSWPCRPDEVKAAYRRLAKQTHPDRGGRAADFRRVSEAYQRLLTALGAR